MLGGGSGTVAQLAFCPVISRQTTDAQSKGGHVAELGCFVSWEHKHSFYAFFGRWPHCELRRIYIASSCSSMLFCILKKNGFSFRKVMIIFWDANVLFFQRVMPTSFFLLLRFFLRIDGVLIRMNDTRLYHEVTVLIYIGYWTCWSQNWKFENILFHVSRSDL